MLSNQEIFTKVRNHLLSQNKRAVAPSAVTAEPACKYRAPDGSMCAAGCLITDDAYNCLFEGNGVHSRGVSDMLCKSGVDMSNETTANLVARLQCLHDNFGVQYWRDQLAHIALNYNLTVEESK